MAVEPAVEPSCVLGVPQTVDSVEMVNVKCRVLLPMLRNGCSCLPTRRPELDSRLSLPQHPGNMVIVGIVTAAECVGIPPGAGLECVELYCVSRNTSFCRGCTYAQGQVHFVSLVECLCELAAK
jgi:hypothetical protein